MTENRLLITDNQLPLVSARFVRGLQANLRYWQGLTAVINDDIIRELDPDFPNVVRTVEMGLELAETWRETAVLILQCFFWVEGSGRVPQWRPLVENCLAVMPAPDNWLQFRLLKQLGQLQRIQWDLETAVNTFRQAATIAQTLQNNQAIAEIHMNLCQTFQHQRQYKEAEIAGAEALTRFTESPPRLKATTLQTLGLIAKDQGQYELAATHFQQALTLFHECETFSITDITRTMNALALTHQEQKQFAAALQIYQKVAKLLDHTTKEEDKIRTALNQGSLLYDWGKLVQAENAFRRAEQMLRQQKGLLSLKALTANNLGCILRNQEIWAAAEKQLQKSINFYRQLGDDLMLANAIGNLAKLYLRQGMLDKALCEFDEASQLAAKFPQNAWARSQQADYEAKIAEIRTAD